MEKLSINLLAALTTLLIYSTDTNACTDFRITAKDGTVLITRSLEFALDLKSNLRSSNRNRVFTTTAADGTPGMTWKAKYGYVFLDGLNVDLATDGMNEAGLTFEALYLPNFAQYQTVPAGKNKQALPYMSVGDWALSNFKTVAEVKQALANVYVYQGKIAGLGDASFPLHFAFYDSTGAGIVVEYISGKMNVYDNKIGVMTNSPGYDWHITNLANYVNLSPVNPAPITSVGVTISANGQGFGMLGLPGDITPPSRFVKIAALLKLALPADNAAGALNQAEHIINNVDIVMGEVREPDSGKFTTETTQWVVFKDATHKMFYYRTYGDPSLHAVDVTKIDFSENAPRLKMPIASPETIQDMTGQFLKTTGN